MMRCPKCRDKNVVYGQDDYSLLCSACGYTGQNMKFYIPSFEENNNENNYIYTSCKECGIKYSPVDSTCPMCNSTDKERKLAKLAKRIKKAEKKMCKIRRDIFNETNKEL